MSTPAPHNDKQTLARVLLVDDTAANLRLLEIMLRGLQLDITAVSSGAQALECVQTEEYAVILLDVRMKEMDGYETATRIRDLEKNHLRLTPIIFVTAEYHTEVQVRKGYTVGAVDYLLKPIVREILVAKVMFFVELVDTRRRLQEHLLQEHKLNLILRELEFARNIQRSILPVAPDHPGVKMYASLETAREVGGDFYDVNTCHIGSERRFCAVVGDVMGKGMPAALVMVLSLTVLREATRMSGSPRTILDRANAMLYHRFQTMPGSNAASAACISLDVETRTLYYCVAGHEDIMLWSAAASAARPLRSRGFTLGLFEDGRYEELAVPLAAGDKILMYTDGVTEARSRQGEFFSRERLMELVDQYGAEPVDQLGDRILQTVRDFQGSVQRDDIAILLLEVE